MPAPPRSASNARKISETDLDVLTRIERGATQQELATYDGCSRASVRAATQRAREARAQAARQARRPASRRASAKAKAPELPAATEDGRAVVYVAGTEASSNAYGRWLDHHDYASSALGKDALARQAADQIAALRAEQEARTGLRFDPAANDGAGAFVHPEQPVEDGRRKG